MAILGARAAAERALEIDPDLAEAHVCLALALSTYDWDFEGAAHHYRRALELNPSDADAHRLYAEHLRFQGRFDEALRETRQAVELDPLSSAPQIETGIILYLSRRYDQAIDEFGRLLEVNPRFTYAHFFLALAHIQKQQYDKAFDALSVPGRWRQSAAGNADGLHPWVTGRVRRHGKPWADCRSSRDNRSISPWHSALIHLGLGEHDWAIIMEQATRLAIGSFECCRSSRFSIRCARIRGFCTGRQAARQSTRMRSALC